jgi:hypothetical protein
MDDPLRLIRYLYGEDEDESTVARRLSEDEALCREYERLRETKERLDDRPARRPDPAVVDQVVETARSATQRSPSTARPDGDRPARPPTRSWTRRLQMVGAALALGLFVGIGWLQLPGPSEEPTAGSATGELDATAQQTVPAAADERRRGADTVPAWDESDELIRINRRLEQLQTQSGPNSWGMLQSVDRRRP